MNKTAAARITSTANSVVKHLTRLREKVPKFSQNTPTSSTIVCGSKLMHELMGKGILPVRIVAHDSLSRPDAEQRDPLLRAQQVLYASEHVMHKISGLESSVDMLGEYRIPSPVNLLDHNFAMRNLAIIHRLSDPGNAGTIMRTCCALGYDALHVSDCTVNVFNDKCVRASRATGFHYPLSTGDFDYLASVVKERRLVCFVAQTAPQLQRNMDSQFNQRNLDSRLHQRKVEPHFQKSMDSQLFHQRNTEPQFNQKNMLNLENIAHIQKVMSKFRGFALVLGNEHHGVNVEQWKQHLGSDCVYNVHVPMKNEMDSLNVHVAGSILLYNLKQLQK